MKKQILFMSTIIAMISCGSKNPTTGGHGIGTDRETIDSIAKADSLAAQADGVETAPADLWTEEVVEQQVRQMYDRLNELVNTIDFNINQMDEEFCTGYYLSVKHDIARYDADAQGDMRFYGDEGGYRWWAGVVAPLEIVSVEAELLSGNQARAEVHFKIDPKLADRQDGLGEMTLLLWMENGRWCVNDFYAPEVFGDCGYLGTMEAYAREHNIPLSSDEEPTEGAPV